MKKLVLVLIIFTVVGLAGWWWANSHRLGKFETADQVGSTPPTSSMKLNSTAFDNNQFIPAKYTCDGDNVNPPLIISAIPAETKSLVLVVDDPDAPAGDWVHWLLWNISPTTSEIVENSVPEGAVVGLTDFGENKYGGPCPPSGTHHYQFKLYALDTMLDLPTSTRKSQLESALQGHILEQTLLIGLYKR